MTRHFLKYLAAALLVCNAAGARAQASSPVRIAIADRISPTDELSGAVVIRRSNADNRDVVVIKEGSLTPQVLGGALALLRKLDTQPRPSQDRYIYVKGSVANEGKALPTETVKKLNAIIHQLERAPKAQIGNLGQGRWIERPNASIK